MEALLLGSHLAQSLSMLVQALHYDSKYLFPEISTVQGVLKMIPA
jgi:hypothetical protein